MAIDLHEVLLWDDFSVYQLLGFLTVFLALVNICLYTWAAYLMWRTRHDITRRLKHKLIVEILLTFTTVMMGIGAFVEAPGYFWQIAYVCRVGLLAVAPFVLYRLVKACLTILHTREEVDDGEAR